MRIHAGLPKTSWADAVSTTVYLINRGPSVPMGFKIPEEEWQGKEVSLSHLKVFGCVSYVRIKDADRDKLDPKARKRTFIGYGADDMGYRFWDDQNRKIIRRRDVTFNESMVYKDMFAGDAEGTKKPPEKEKSELEDITDKDLAGSSGSSSDRTSEEINPVTPEVRRSSRTIRPPQRYSSIANYLLLTDDGEPQCYEALQMDDSAQWGLAMQEEMNSLEKNNTWFLTTLPAGKKALQNKWVLRVKKEHDGKKRYKARLVVKGFQQKRGIDYNEIFSPVVKMTTIRLVLSIVTVENLDLEQLDVKTTFLHGDLDEDIYMVQLEGYQIAGKENLVCKLTKSLYGVKQAPRQWYLKFENFMSRSGYKKSDMDPCCYTRHFDSSYIILLLYVDDMLVAGSDMEKINRLKEQLFEEFEMKDLDASK
ncbi:Retrovirus-related Pol polyprotein from transposon TNT 1-94-like protein [Drosera capensis]